VPFNFEMEQDRNSRLFELFGTSAPVALVMGAGKARIGQAIAQLLGQRGCRLAVHAHSSLSEAESFCAEARSQDVQALAVSADISDEMAVVDMVEKVYDEYERIDILVNTAAIWNPLPLENVRAEDVRKHFEVNVLGTFLCAKHVGEVMIGQPRGGAIVNFGDWAVARPYEGFAAYFASKGAIETMTRSLAVELTARNEGIRVNAILPGPVMQPEGTTDAQLEKVHEGTLGKRSGTGEDIAHATLMLIENPFINGASLPVDAGRSIFAANDNSWKLEPDQ
jgi:pteridine reductase